MAGKLRDGSHTKSVVLRMGDTYVDLLDQLVRINNRSRREVIEALIFDAILDYSDEQLKLVYPDLPLGKSAEYIMEHLDEY